MSGVVREVSVMALLAGVALASVAWAENSPSSAQPSPSTERTQTRPHHAYLGITVEPLHRAFALHLPDALIPGQGISLRGTQPRRSRCTVLLDRHHHDTRETRRVGARRPVRATFPAGQCRLRTHKPSAALRDNAL